VLEESALPAFEEPGPPRSASEYELRIDVRPSDLDHNGHINNVRYVDWAFDALPRTLIEGRRCTRLVSRYVREVLHPGTVVSRANAEHREGLLSTTHLIEGASGEACRIAASWSDVELPSDGTVD
jgi:medium-chain acyl-[acyl-carrier-protein] hydrolase